MELIFRLNFHSQTLDVRDPRPSGQCANTVAYIADVTGFGILVYDMRRNRSWRVQNKLLYSCPAYGTFTIAGESFDLMDGVFGLALSPPRGGYGGKKRFRTYLPPGPFNVDKNNDYYSTDHVIHNNSFIFISHLSF